MPLSYDESLGPLMTEFTPPSSCFVPKIEISEGQYVKLTSVGYGVGCGPVGYSFKSDCFPPVTLTDKVGYPRDSHDDRPFSPGYFCPSGWSSGCSWTKTSESIENDLEKWEKTMLANMKVGEAHIACCPNGYTCNTTFGPSCLRYGTDGDIIVGTMINDRCDKTTTTAITLDVFGHGITAYGQMEPIHLIKMRGKTLTITADTTPNPNTTTSTTDSTASNTGITTTIATTVILGGEKEIDSSSRALSTEVKVGIGVAVSLVALLAGAALIFFLYRRNQAKHIAPAAELEAEGAGGSVTVVTNSHELDADSKIVKSSQAFRKHSETELASQAIYELPATDIETESKQIDTANMPLC